MPKERQPIVLGRIRFPKSGGMTFQTNSIERAVQAAKFFAAHLRFMRAVEHWRGNTHLTLTAIILHALQQGDPHTFSLITTELAAEWNAIATSLIASCQLHDIEPWAYLRDVLTLLPAWPNRDVLQLAPKFWDHTAVFEAGHQRMSFQLLDLVERLFISSRIGHRTELPRVTIHQDGKLIWGAPPP